MQTITLGENRFRLPSASWFLLLASGVLAVLALAQPVVYRQAPSRHVGISICPSAELAGTDAPFAPVLVLLDRLASNDHVTLLLPEFLGGQLPAMSPAEAARRVRALPILPIAANELFIPAEVQDVQRLYRFTPAPDAGLESATTTTLPLPAMRPPVEVRELAATACPDGRGVEVFVKISNDSMLRKHGAVDLMSPAGKVASWELDIPPGQSAQRTVDLPDQPEYLSAVVQPAGALSARYLARQTESRAKVALLGADDPHLRRFVEINPSLEWAASPEQADVILANQADLPPSATSTPALVIAPPNPPPGWERGGTVGPLALSAATPSSSPILTHVDLAGSAIRQVQLWRPTGPTTLSPIVTLNGTPLILAGDHPPRIYIAFDLSSANTNMPVTETAYVVMLENAFQFLQTKKRGTVTYTSQSALSATMRPQASSTYSAAAWPMNAGIASPGIYATGPGQYVAINVSGTLTHATATNAPPDIALPSHIASAQTVALWPWCIVPCIALALFGWLCRIIVRQ